MPLASELSLGKEREYMNVGQELDPMALKGFNPGSIKNQNQKEKKERRILMSRPHQNFWE